MFEFLRRRKRETFSRLLADSLARAGVLDGHFDPKSFSIARGKKVIALAELHHEWARASRVRRQRIVDDLVEQLGHLRQPIRRRLLITVHGIRTYGDWQERFERLAVSAVGPDAIKVLNYKYGYFSILAFIVPPFRWLVTRRFRTDLAEWCAAEKWSRIDIVGHSFGTHIVAWALHGIPREERPKIHTIAFAGSVLRASFPWQELVGHSVERVVNDCGTRDNVLLLNQLFVLFTGMAGRSGFSGAHHDFFRSRYHAFGHSDYFVNAEQLPDDAWLREYWLPLVTSTGPVDPNPQRPRPTTRDGIVETVMNNLEPIKLIVYMTPVLIAAVWIFGLYLGEKNARREADDARREADNRRREAEDRRRDADHRYSMVLSSLGHAFLAADDELRAAAHFAAALERFPANSYPVDRLFNLVRQRRSQWRFIHRESAEKHALSDDGTFSFVADDKPTEVPTKRKARNADDPDDPDDSAPVQTMTLTAPDQTWKPLLAYDPGDEPIIPKRFTLDRTIELPEFAEILKLVFDPGSRYLAMLLDGGRVWIVERDGTLRHEIELSSVHSVGFVPGEDLLYTISHDEIRFHPLKENPAQGSIPLTMRLSRPVQEIKLTRADGRWIIQARESNSISYWSCPIVPSPVWKLEPMERDPRRWSFRDWDDQAKFAYDLTQVEDYMRSGEWKIKPERVPSRWPAELTHRLDERDWQEKFLQDEGSFRQSTAQICKTAAISGDASTVVTSAGRSHLKVWRAGHPAPVMQLVHDGTLFVQAVKVDQLGQSAFVLFSTDKENPDHAFSVFSLRDGRRVGGGVVKYRDTLLNISPDGQRIVVRTNTGTLEVRNARTNEVVGGPLRGGASQAGISPEGRRLAGVTGSGLIQVWDIETGLPLTDLLDPGWKGEDAFSAPWFSTDGRCVSVVGPGPGHQLLTWHVHPTLEPGDVSRFLELIHQYYGVRLFEAGTLKLVPSKSGDEILRGFDAADRSDLAQFAREMAEGAAFKHTR